jgi:hypothetical protein
MFKKSSPLKQLGQMEPNLAGSIYVRSKPGIDGPWVCPICNQLQLITITNYDYPMSGLWDTILKGTHPGTIYARFGPYIDASKYGRQGHFLFLIGYCLKKSSHLKLLGKMEPILAGSIYVRSSIKLLHLVPLHTQGPSMPGLDLT